MQSSFGMNSSRNKNANVFAWITSSETLGKKYKRQLATNSIESAGFKSSFTLKGHYSCVNTIEFSKGYANLMCSGSDDKRVLLWNILGNSFDKDPIKAFIGHLSNIFCAVFSSDNRYIISCGYDVEKNGRNPTSHNVKYKYVPSVNRYLHDGAVYRVSIKPDEDEIFLSASDDCTVALWDVRTSEAQGRIKSRSSFNWVEFNHTHMYNNNTAYRTHKKRNTTQQSNENNNNANNTNNKQPQGSEEEEEEVKEPNINDQCFQSDYGVDTNLFTTCSGSHGIQLWDLRKCFGENPQPLKQYDTMGLRDVTSVTFNTSGTAFVASIPRFFPTLYSVQEENPLAVFYAPDFKNTCTAKSCCFAGDKEECIVSGSDDFKVFIWKVPTKSQLDEHVLEVSGFSNSNNNSDAKNSSQYEETLSSSPNENPEKPKMRKYDSIHSDQLKKPKKLKLSKGHEFVMTVNAPKQVLTGHRSIVNNVRYNYSFPLLATSGVEKTIKLWSPISISDDVPSTPAPQRHYSAMDYLNLLHNMRFMQDEESTLEESENTLALFDFFKAYENSSDSDSDISDEDIDNEDLDDDEDSDEDELEVSFEY